jgi:hypothetical protein
MDIYTEKMLPPVRNAAVRQIVFAPYMGPCRLVRELRGRLKLADVVVHSESAHVTMGNYPARRARHLTVPQRVTHNLRLRALFEPDFSHAEDYFVSSRFTL